MSNRDHIARVCIALRQHRLMEYARADQACRECGKRPNPAASKRRYGKQCEENCRAIYEGNERRFVEERRHWHEPVVKRQAGSHQNEKNWNEDCELSFYGHDFVSLTPGRLLTASGGHSVVVDSTD